jgi:pimeloyl-ACP methyl ester carboxylesterase
VIERGFVRTSAGYLHYRAAGQGEPVLLLHINQQSSAMYLELLSELGRSFRAIAVDNPSHGSSDHVSAQPSVGDYARWLTEVLDGLGIAQASVLGEANGAAIAAELAATYPDRVRRLVLVNCPFYVDRSNLKERLAPMRERTLPADSTGFPAALTIDFMLTHDPEHSPMRPTQDWMDRLNVAHMEAGRDRWQGFDALHAYDMAPRLPAIRCPVLMLVGEHFPYASVRGEFAKRVPQLETKVIEGARFCMAWERAEEVGRLAAAFLR